MYKSIVRPLLFRLSTERIHDLTVGALRFVGWVPGGRAILRMAFACQSRSGQPSLAREVFGIRFANPVGLAAGFDKNAVCFRELGALGFGFVEVGTVTPEPQSGNPRPRLFRLPQQRALINRMGLNNDGMEAVGRRLRRGRRGQPVRRGVIVGVNIGKNTLTPNEKAPDDYLKAFRRLYPYADYFTVNVSCPNVADMTALQSCDNIAAIVDPLVEFRRAQSVCRPILLKISPDLTPEQIDDIVEMVAGHALDGIVATNTTTSRERLTTPSAALAQIGNGGLSGAPLTARALEVVRYVAAKAQGRFPVIASGGVMTPQDAQNMLDAGASLVQVYTGMVYEGPSLAKRICKHLQKQYGS